MKIKIFQVQQKAVYNSYMKNQGALKRIVADFLQSLLLIRPNDVVCFAIRYFTTFDKSLKRDYFTGISCTSRGHQSNGNQSNRSIKPMEQT